MRRRSGWVCALVGLTVLLVSVGPASPAAVKKCPKGKVTRVINGKRACVAAKAYRQRVTRLTPGAVELQRVLTGGPIKLRQKNGRVVANVIRPKLAAAAVSAYNAAEAELTVAVRAAMGQTANARLHGAGDTSLIINRGTDGSVSGSITKTVATNGQTLTMNVGLTGHPDPAGGNGTMDIEVGAGLDDGAGTTTARSFGIKDFKVKQRQTCPDTTGAVQVDERFEGGTTGSTTFGSTRVKLGTLREGVTVAVKATGHPQMGADGKFKPFVLTVTASSDYSRSVQGLAFLQSRTRAVSSGKLTGTINPATGLLTGATITTNVRTSGFEGSKAAADAAFRPSIEKMLNDEAGRVLKSLKDIEANVQKGACNDSYDISMVIFTNGSFATHSSSGTLNAGLTATAAKSPAQVLTASTTAAYNDVTWASTTDCTYASDPAIPGTISFTLSITPAGLLHVVWTGSGELKALGTATCPAPPDPPAVIPGQVGPSLMLPTPQAFDLPISGGQQAVGGGFTDGGSGWTHSGTITVTRRPPQ